MGGEMDSKTVRYLMDGWMDIPKVTDTHTLMKSQKNEWGKPEAQREAVNCPRSQRAWVGAPCSASQTCIAPGKRLAGKARSQG